MKLENFKDFFGFVYQKQKAKINESKIKGGEQRCRR